MTTRAAPSPRPDPERRHDCRPRPADCHRRKRRYLDRKAVCIYRAPHVHIRDDLVGLAVMLATPGALTQMMPPLDAAACTRNLGLVEEGRRLVALAERQGVVARLLGGAAILIHCPQALAAGGYREIADLDLVVAAGSQRRLADLLVAEGYEPEPRFNALHGHSRMLFYGPLSQLDILVGNFSMCHMIKLGKRLGLDDPTLTVTDLLLTKLQIVELNSKDAWDLAALLSEHEVMAEPPATDSIDLSYLGGLVSDDWGLWRTLTGTMARLREEKYERSVTEKLDAIDDHLRRVPKTSRHKLRARVGDRVTWFKEPDEVRSTPAQGGS